MRLPLALLPLALAGCQTPEERHAAETGEIEISNASPEQATALMSAAAPKSGAKPGLWRGALKIEDVDMGPGGEGQRQLELLRSMEREAVECRTAEQLKPFDVSKLEQVAGACTFTRLVQKGGKVDAEIRCDKVGTLATVIAITGTTSPTGFDVRTENRTGTAGQPGYSRIRIRATGSRVGECSGGQAS